MIDFIIGVLCCYLALSLVAISRVRTLGHPDAPAAIRLQAALMAMIVILPMLVWHGARGITLGIEKGPVDDEADQ